MLDNGVAVAVGGTFGSVACKVTKLVRQPGRRLLLLLLLLQCKLIEASQQCQRQQQHHVLHVAFGVGSCRVAQTESQSETESELESLSVSALGASGRHILIIMSFN